MTDKEWTHRKSNERLAWGDHHMLLALITAQRSADPNTQVGAVIVTPDNRVVGLGYNGPPRGLAPCQMPWAREGPLHKTKYAYVRHAEQNAITNANRSIVGCTAYVTMHPCDGCARDIVQAGIKEVFYLSNPYHDKPPTLAAQDMLTKLDIGLHKFEWTNPALISQVLSTISPS